MLIAEDVARSQQELTPTEDLAPYAGKWVALRDGKVIASAADLQTLRHRRDVDSDDVAVPVAPSGAGAFVL
jgi:hypothetical protein